MNEIKILAEGNIFTGQAASEIKTAADHYRHLKTVSHSALAVVVMAAGTFGISAIWRIISPTLRARNNVERVIMAILILCSSIAIFTTIGIVLSVLFESTFDCRQLY